jgi:hypothetical protein
MVSQIVTLFLGDVVRTRKAHPCGGDVWVVERLGADVGIRCRTCGRFALMERVKFERRIRQFLERGIDKQEPISDIRYPRSESVQPEARRRRRPPKSGLPEPRAPSRRVVKRANIPRRP